jgi:hypothetical protein
MHKRDKLNCGGEKPNATATATPARVDTGPPDVGMPHNPEGPSPDGPGMNQWNKLSCGRDMSLLASCFQLVAIPLKACP